MVTTAIWERSSNAAVVVKETKRIREQIWRRLWTNSGKYKWDRDIGEITDRGKGSREGKNKVRRKRKGNLEQHSITRSWSPWEDLILSLYCAIYFWCHKEVCCWPATLAGRIEGILTNASEGLAVTHEKLTTCTVSVHCPKASTDFQRHSRWPRQSHWRQHNHRVKTRDVDRSSGLPSGLVTRARGHLDDLAVCWHGYKNQLVAPSQWCIRAHSRWEWRQTVPGGHYSLPRVCTAAMSTHPWESEA